jgi:hypothetical protein
MSETSADKEKRVLVATSDIPDSPTEPTQQIDDGASAHTTIPWTWKIASVVLVSCINFGSSWSGGILSAMKTNIKTQLKINNTQYALLSGSEDFVKTCLMLFTGLVTDRLGGAGKSLAEKRRKNIDIL